MKWDGNYSLGNLTCPFCGSTELSNSYRKGREAYLIGHDPPDHIGLTTEKKYPGGDCPGSDMLIGDLCSPQEMINRKLDHILALLEQP